MHTFFQEPNSWKIKGPKLQAKFPTEKIQESVNRLILTNP